MGVIGAASGGLRLLQDADLIIMVGARCDYRVGHLQPPSVRDDAVVVRIDVDPAQLGQGVGAHHAVLGDPSSVLAQLVNVCRNGRIQPFTDWHREVRERREAFQQQVLDARQQAPEGLHALDIIEAVRQVMTNDTVIIIDGGNIGQWAHQTLCDRYPGHWVTCGASGVIGYGIPGAMAARLLYPDRPVILISGDGSLTFSVAELEPAARQNLGFVVLVADDQAWGITLTGQTAQIGQGITAELGAIRFDLMASAFGADGIRVHSVEEIAPAIREGLRSNRPTLIHVPIVRSSPVDR
jgi:thiamine pyrophosphate-dependent acetolactate synthase large subunit-like protein